MTDLRQPNFYIIVGAPGAGKTEFTVRNLIKNETGNVIIFKHESNINDKATRNYTLKNKDNWRQGAASNIPVKCKFSAMDEDDYQDFLEWVLEGRFRNGLLVVDDAGDFEDGKSTKRFKRLMRMRRHYQIDLAMLYHGLTDVPIDNFRYANYLIMFETSDNFFYKKNKIPNFDLMEAANDQVKKNIQKGDYYTPVIVNLRMPRVNRP